MRKNRESERCTPCVVEIAAEELGYSFSPYVIMSVGNVADIISRNLRQMTRIRSFDRYASVEEALTAYGISYSHAESGVMANAKAEYKVFIPAKTRPADIPHCYAEELNRFDPDFFVLDCLTRGKLDAGKLRMALSRAKKNKEAFGANQCCS